MRATIHPQDRAIRIDDELLTIADAEWPAGPVLKSFVVDDERPVEVIHFDGAVGTIQRRSLAPGRTDVEHFIGAEPLKPYADLHAAAKKQRAEEKRKKDQEEEARAQHSLELAQKAQDEADKAKGAS